MARAPTKSKVESGTTTPTGIDPLKPKTEKAKVTKVKGDKPAVKKEAAVKKDATAKKDDAGKVEKVKPVTGEEAQRVILEYLTAQNRPFSATEIQANLHGRVCLFSYIKEIRLGAMIIGTVTTLVKVV